MSSLKARIHHDKRRYRERRRIEATFCRLKDFRRITTLYDKLARNDASAVALGQSPGPVLAGSGRAADRQSSE